MLALVVDTKPCNNLPVIADLGH